GPCAFVFLWSLASQAQRPDNDPRFAPLPAFLRSNTVTSYQTVTTNPPRLSPARFDSDTGPADRNGRAVPGHKNIVPPKASSQLKWTTNAIPPRAPAVFNPDPGAMIKSPPTNLDLFTNEFPLPPVFQGEPIPPALAPPRT